MRLFLNNKNGFSLVEVLVASGIIAMIGVGGAQVYFSHVKSNHTMSQMQAIFNQRNLIINTLNSAEGWQRTIANNSSMSCLANKTDCAGAGGVISVYDQSNQPLTQTASNFGFNDRSTVCNTYDSQPEICSHRFEVSWRAVCPSGMSCINPQIKLMGQFQTRLDAKRLQSARYNFDIFRAPADGSLKKSCESIGGTYDPATRNCTLSAYGNVCAPGTVVKGIDPATKTMICAPLFENDIVCPAGTVLFGFDPGGNPRCETKICTVPRICQLNPMLCPEERHMIESSSGGDGSCGGDSGPDGAGCK